MDLSKPQIQASVTDQPVNRIVIRCLEAGQTLWPIKTGVLEQMASYKGKPDVLAAIIAAAHKKHIEVYARIACLRWGAPEARPEEKVLVRHPELAERFANGACADLISGSYASPFNTKVVTVLENTVRELATAYPKLDGLVLDCRLSPTVVLGYSDSARVAYLKHAQIDTIDIDEDNDAGSVALAREWYEWRIAQMSSLITDLSRCYKTIRPKAKIASMDAANFYRILPSLRNRSLDDWATWVSTGAVDEVILDGAWSDPSSEGDYPVAVAKALTLKAPVRLSIDLTLHVSGTPTNPLTELERQQGEPIRSIVVELSDPNDLAISRGFWTVTLPQIEQVLSPKVRTGQ